MDENDALNSSDSATQDAPLTPTADAPAPVEAPSADAGSSSAAPGDDRKSSLDIVRDAVAATRAANGPAASPAAETGSPTVPETAGAEQQDEQDGKSDDEFGDVPFHKHPRFRALVAQRNEFKQDAERYQNIQAFLDRSGVSGEEAKQALDLAAMAKVDPIKAWEALKPIAQDLASRAGLLMPADLRERIQKGELTREAAAEISRLRAQQGAQQSRQQMEADQRQREQAQQAQTAVLDAVREWETSARKDIDFGALEDDLAREVAYLHAREGRPSTVSGVKEQLDRAMKAVKGRRGRPAPSPTPARVSGGATAAAPARNRPPTSLEIVQARGRV